MRNAQLPQVETYLIKGGTGLEGHGSVRPNVEGYVKLHSICNSATNQCYLLQTRLVVTQSTIQISALADHLIHYTTESKAPCSNPKGRLRTAERKRKTFIINHHQTCDSDWYSESQNLLYKLSLHPPRMEASMLRSLCNRIKPDFYTTPIMVCD
jgi:hypothetical protein